MMAATWWTRGRTVVLLALACACFVLWRANEVSKKNGPIRPFTIVSPFQRERKAVNLASEVTHLRSALNRIEANTVEAVEGMEKALMREFKQQNGDLNLNVNALEQMKRRQQVK